MGKERSGSSCFIGTEFEFGMMKRFGRWTAVMDAQPVSVHATQWLICKVHVMYITPRLKIRKSEEKEEINLWHPCHHYL